jgi:hypothetical protein
LEGQRKTTKSLSHVSGAAAKIWTWHFPNTILELQGDTNPFGRIHVKQNGDSMRTMINAGLEHEWAVEVYRVWGV